jgi:hypothetical protein
VLKGIFFAIPLYLQIVQGFNALETGSACCRRRFAAVRHALVGSKLASRFAPRTIVRAGFLALLAACTFLLATIDPNLDTLEFGIAMAVLGVGMGLVVSQLGNVVQSGPWRRTTAARPAGSNTPRSSSAARSAPR